MCILLLFSMSFVVMGPASGVNSPTQVEKTLEKKDAENQKFFSDGKGNTGKVINCTYNNGNFGQDDSKYNSVFLQCTYDSGKVTCKASHSTSYGGFEYTIKNKTKLEESILKNNKGKSNSNWCPEAVFRKGTEGIAFGSLSAGKKNLETCCSEKGEDVKSGSYCGAETRTNDYVGANKSTTGSSYTGTSVDCAIYEWDGSTIISSKASEGRSDAQDRESTQKLIDQFKKDKDKTVKDRKVSFKEGCGILSDDASEMLRSALKYIIIASVILVIVLGIVDFIKAIAGAVDDGMKKAWKRLLRRIISLGLLLLLPALITFVLTEIDIEGVNEGSIFCGIEE